MKRIIFLFLLVFFLTNIHLSFAAPQWSNNVTSHSSPVTYSSSRNYQFNVTWSDHNISTVLLEHNFTGSMTNFSWNAVNSTGYQYKNYTVEANEIVDLYNGSTSYYETARTIHIFGAGSDDNSIKTTVGSNDTDDLYLWYNVTGDLIDIFFKASDNKVKWIQTVNTTTDTNIANLTFQSTVLNLDLTWNAVLNNGTIRFDTSNGNDLVIYYELSGSDDIRYLGHSDGDTNTEKDLLYGSTDISIEDEDYTTQNGIIVYKPTSYLSGDSFKFSVNNNESLFVPRYYHKSVGYQYKNYTVEADEIVDLFNGSTSYYETARTIHIFGAGNENNSIKTTAGSRYIDDLYLWYNGTGDLMDVFYKNTSDNKVKWIQTVNTTTDTNIANLTFQSTVLNLDLTWNAVLNNGTIRFDTSNGNDLVIYYELSGSDDIRYLGHSDGDTNTDKDLLYGSTDISIEDEDYTTQNGIIVYKPTSYLSDDSFKFSVNNNESLFVPEREYYFSVSGLSAGKYSWKSFASNKTGNQNVTDQLFYTVNPETTTTTDSGDGGGGGGGGGSGGGTNSSSVKVSSFWTQMKAGTENSWKISTSSIHVNQIDITVNKAKASVKLTVEKLGEKPSGVIQNPSGKIYQYIRITKQNIENEDIDSAKIKFKVNKSWINENNIKEMTIVLSRYNTSWEDLPTNKIDADNNWIYYQASTDGFSTFAIHGEEGENTTTTTTTLQTTTTTLEDTGGNITGATTTTLPKAKFDKKYSIFIAIGIAVLLFLGGILVFVIKFLKPDDSHQEIKDEFELLKEKWDNKIEREKDRKSEKE